MAKGSDWYAACPHCKGSGSSSEPKEPKVHYRSDGSITPNPKYTPRPNSQTIGSKPKESNPKDMGRYGDKDDWREKKTKPKPSNPQKYPDYKPKPKDGGGSSITRKPKPKSPAPGAAKKYK
jgi:hypothetical protein